MKPKRRNFLIDRGFQVRFMRFVVFSCVLVCTISLFSQYFFVEWLLRILRNSKALPLDVVLDLVEISEHILSFTVVLILSSMAIVITLSLFYSHRIAGPIYNMKKTMDAYLAGDTKAQVRLRKSDYLFDLADKINLVIEEKKS